MNNLLQVTQLRRSKLRILHHALPPTFQARKKGGCGRNTFLSLGKSSFLRSPAKTHRRVLMAVRSCGELWFWR